MRLGSTMLGLALFVGFFSAYTCDIENLGMQEIDKGWPHRHIPYVIKTTEFMLIDTAVIDVIVEAILPSIHTAMQLWENKTCIRFEEHQLGTSAPHILVDAITPSCSADVGFHNHTDQTALFTCGECGGAMMLFHQLGHSIGLIYEDIDTGRYIYPTTSDAQPSLTALYTDFLKEQTIAGNSIQEGPSSTEDQNIYIVESPPNGLTGAFEEDDVITMINVDKPPNFFDIKSVNLFYQCGEGCIAPTGVPTDGLTESSPFQCKHEGYLLMKDGICICQCPFPYKVDEISHKCEDFEGEVYSFSLAPGDEVPFTFNTTHALSSPTDLGTITVHLKALPHHFIKIKFGEDCQIGSGDDVITRDDCTLNDRVDVRLGRTGFEGMILCRSLSNLALTTQTAGDDVLIVLTNNLRSSRNSESTCEITFTTHFDHCKSIPCYNGGTCRPASQEMGGFVCECPPEITGEQCDTIGATTVSCDFDSVCNSLTMTISSNFSVALAHTAYEFGRIEPVLPPISVHGPDNNLFVYAPKPTAVEDEGLGIVTFKTLGMFSGQVVGSHRCLSLDWFIGRPNLGDWTHAWVFNSRIQIIKRSGDGSDEVVYRKMGRRPWASRWIHIERDMESDPSGFELIIQLINPSLMYRSYGMVAIDNLEVHHQSCDKRCDQTHCMNGGVCYTGENHSRRCICPVEYAGPTCKYVGLNRTCTFEDGTCHFIFPRQSMNDLNFTRVDALSPNNSQHSHVVGAGGSRHYISLEPTPGVTATTVNITTNGTVYTVFNGKFKTAPLGVEGPICVEFDYYLSGDHHNGIMVYHRSHGPRPEEPILTYLTNQNPGWIQLRLDTTSLHVKDRISFKGWRSVASGNIAGFDNINILLGNC